MGKQKRGRSYEIQLQEVEDKSKVEWKKMVKQKIKRKMEKIIEEKEEHMTKLRHQKKQRFERQKYLEEVGSKDASRMIRTRLEINDIGNTGFSF